MCFNTFMQFDITQLKRIRKQLDMKQHQFANYSGVSQSMIAKIESNRLDPAYSKARKIEQAIIELSRNQQKQAKDIMTKKIISLKESAKIKDIITIMKKHAISQVPIIRKDNVIGMVTEASILKHKNPHTAKEVMEDAPPIITKNTGIDAIKNMLTYFPIILVKDKENLTGLITKADIIKHLS